MAGRKRERFFADPAADGDIVLPRVIHWSVVVVSNSRLVNAESRAVEVLDAQGWHWLSEPDDAVQQQLVSRRAEPVGSGFLLLPCQTS